jgi:hypothetical protein
MIEVVRRIALQANLFHYASRSHIRRNGEGDDFVEAELTKGITEHGLRAFRSQSFVPVRPREPPPEFHCWSERGFEGDIGNSNEPNEWRLTDELRGEQTETMLALMRLNAGGYGIALFSCETGWKELHHRWICVQGGERLAVRVTPGTKEQSGSGYHPCMSLPEFQQ